jgi:hypothetical protein
MSHIRRAVLPISLAAVAVVVAACGFEGSYNNHRVGSDPYVEGSGNTASETRGLEAFHSVEASRGLSVKITRGTAYSATVSADDNLIPMIVTRVSGDVLTVMVEGSLSTHNDLTVVLKVAGDLNEIGVESGTTLVADGVTATGLSLSADSGSILTVNGNCTDLTVESVSGSSVQADGLRTQTAHVTADSGSSVHVRAIQSVDGTVRSGSTLTVSGGASSNAVQKDVSSTVATE